MQSTNNNLKANTNNNNNNNNNRNNKRGKKKRKQRNQRVSNFRPFPRKMTANQRPMNNIAQPFPDDLINKINKVLDIFGNQHNNPIPIKSALYKQPSNFETMTRAKYSAKNMSLNQVYYSIYDTQNRVIRMTIYNKVNYVSPSENPYKILWWPYAINMANTIYGHTNEEQEQQQKQFTDLVSLLIFRFLNQDRDIDMIPERAPSKCGIT